METKQYTIIKERYRPNFDDYAESQYTGTLEQLKEMFSYTLECGRAYMHEDGALFVPFVEDIKDIGVLEEALNNASQNTNTMYPSNFCIA